MEDNVRKLHQNKLKELDTADCYEENVRSRKDKKKFLELQKLVNAKRRASKF